MPLSQLQNAWHANNTGAEFHIGTSTGLTPSPTVTAIDGYLTQEMRREPKQMQPLEYRVAVDTDTPIFSNACARGSNDKVGMDAHKLRLASRMVYRDGLTALGLTPCRREIFFIASLPKSGSTWLYRVIGSLPGINYRPMRGPSGLNGAGLSINLWDDIDAGTFKFHPRFACSVFKTHTRFSEQNWQILKANGVRKVVVLVRDLRDVAVSLYHHHRADATHAFYEIVHGKQLDDGIECVIRELMPEYVAWLCGWIAFAAQSEDVLIIRYEDLYDGPENVVNSILGFYGRTVAHDAVAAICRRTRIRSAENLITNLLGKGLAFSTARQGGHGGWRDVFTDRHRSLFDQLADAQHVMAKLGYQP